jgi:hypothetical protein
MRCTVYDHDRDTFAVDDMRNILRRRGVTREKAVFVFLATLTREGGSQPSTREIAEGRVLVAR